MKLLLIQNKSKSIDVTTLPKNVWYTTEKQSYALIGGEVYLINYQDKDYWVPKSFLLTEEEWRDKQLNNLLT